MTKRFLAVLLSAVVMVPGAALAQDRGGWGDRDGPRAERQGRAERPGNGQNDANRERRWNRDGAGRQPQVQVPVQAPPPVQVQPDRENRVDRANGYGERGTRARRDGWQDRGQQRDGGYRDGVNRDRGQFDRNDSRFRNDGRAQWNGGNTANRAQRYDNRGQWNRDWRQDRRYDWNGHRAQNRSAYRLPRYYAPVGRGYGNYGYRRFGVGLTLGNAYFGQNYWISDPWSYRLPDAYGPYRWVRYYGDALLVDVRSGQVVDAIYDIFG